MAKTPAAKSLTKRGSLKRHPSMATLDVPHADKLEKVRLVVEAAASVPTGMDSDTLGAKTGLGDRHAQYHAHGARVLGLADKKDKNWVATSAGRALLKTTPNSDEERQVFREAMKSSNALVRKAVFGPEMSMEELTTLIEKAGFSNSSARRRAACLRTWRRSIQKEQKATT